MTTRRFNFTDRQRIRVEDARVVLLSPEGGRIEFNAVLKLHEYAFPADAFVVIEALRQASLMRFDFGTVGCIRPPERCSLDEFDPPDGVRFSVKVIDPAPGSGRLLGYARHIRPVLLDTPEGSPEGILPVRKANLGNEVWKLELSGGDEAPQLLINEKIPGWKTLPKELHFSAYIFPEVFRQILHAATSDGPPADDSLPWVKDWCAFAESLPGVDPVPEAAADRDSWVDRVTTRFASTQNYLERLLKHEQEES